MAAKDHNSKTAENSFEEIGELYIRAVANDWRTVQGHAQQSLNRLAASRAAAAEAQEYAKLARVLTGGETGKPNRPS